MKVVLFLLIFLFYWNHEVCGDQDGSSQQSSGHGHDPTQPFWATRGKRNDPFQNFRLPFNVERDSFSLNEIESQEKDPNVQIKWAETGPLASSLLDKRTARFNSLFSNDANSPVQEMPMFYMRYLRPRKKSEDPTQPFWATRGKRE